MLNFIHIFDRSYSLLNYLCKLYKLKHHYRSFKSYKYDFIRVELISLIKSFQTQYMLLNLNSELSINGIYQISLFAYFHAHIQSKIQTNLEGKTEIECVCVF